MKLSVHNINGQTTGKEVDLPEDIFGIEPNDHAVWLAVKQYQNSQRRGTHKAKERGEVKGSTRKIKRQKGTGTARAGDIKSPIFRGGGRIFGPRPRNYGIKLNKKVKTLARKSALAGKLKDEALMILEDFSLDAPKTKAYLDILNNLSVSDKRTLLVLAENDANIFLSSRNLPNAEVTTIQDLNVYQTLRSERVILSEGCIEKLKEVFSN